MRTFRRLSEIRKLPDFQRKVHFYYAKLSIELSIKSIIQFVGFTD